MNLEKNFEASYVRVVGDGIGITEKGQRFFTRFYEIFFASSPEVPLKFANTDMKEQVNVLQKGVFQLISFYLLKSDNDYLRSIATTHSRTQYDIPPVLYDFWLSSLLATVKEFDPEYADHIGLAWQIVMTPGILYLKHHYDRAINDQSLNDQTS